MICVLSDFVLRVVILSSYFYASVDDSGCRRWCSTKPLALGQTFGSRPEVCRGRSSSFVVHKCKGYMD